MPKDIIHRGLIALVLVGAIWATSVQALVHQQERVLFYQGFDIKSGATFSIAGTAMTASATELNVLDLTTLGTSQDSKALTLSATGKLTVSAADTIDFNTGVLAIAGTKVTSDATELNYCDITTLGAVQASKVVSASATGKVTFATGDSLDIASGGKFLIGGTVIAASATEVDYTDVTTLGSSQNSKAATFDADGMLTILSADSIQMASGAVQTFASGSVWDHQSGATLKLHGLTIDATEAGYVDGVTAGASANSKVLTLDANGKLTLADADTINFTTITGLQLGGVSITPTAAEINVVDLTTLGTSQDSKAATYSATGKHTVASGDTIDFASTSVLAIAGTAVTSSAAEVNLTDGLVTVYGTIAIGQRIDTVTVTGLGSPREIISVWSINTDSAYGLTVRMAGTNALSVQRPGADVYTAEADSFGVTYCPNIN